MIKKVLYMGIVFYTIFLFSGCSSDEQENQSTITVSGIGTVLVNPDTVQMNVMYSHVAQTTKEAKDEVDKKIRQILDILKDEKIDEKNIKTISLNYDVETEYGNGRLVWVGQRAQQTIVVTINDIGNNPNKLPVLLDKLTAIDRVEIRYILFDIEDKTEFFKQSRELAYQKAYDKASQYAVLSGQKIARVLAISEEKNRDVFRGGPAMGNVAFSDSAGRSQGSSVPSGEQEVTTEITITFLME